MLEIYDIDMGLLDRRACCWTSVGFRCSISRWRLLPSSAYGSLFLSSIWWTHQTGAVLLPCAESRILLQQSFLQARKLETCTRIWFATSSPARIQLQVQTLYLDRWVSSLWSAACSLSSEFLHSELKGAYHRERLCLGGRDAESRWRPRRNFLISERSWEPGLILSNSWVC